jgi:hypothetical protein
MKKVLIFVSILFFYVSLNAQQWAGSTTTTGNIYRAGNVGIGNTAPVSKLELGNDQWLKFQSSTTAGILFREGTHNHTATNVRYGAKIYYDEDDDMLRISTMQDYTENVGICIRRTYPRVGIGSYTVDSHIASPLNIKGPNSNAQLEIGNSTIYNGNYILSYDRVASAYKNLVIRTTADPTMTFLTNGNVGIGCTNPQVKLAVNGTIKATELQITTTPCSDFVFEKGYNLMDLNILEKFVTNNKHLPDVPSAKEFEENGYSVGEMDDILLRKVEELTLYIIQQQKEIEELKSKLK